MRKHSNTEQLLKVKCRWRNGATFHVPRPSSGIREPSFSSTFLATCVSSTEYIFPTVREKQQKSLSVHNRALSRLSSSSFPLRVLLLSQCPSFFFADFTLAHVSDLHSLGFLLFHPLISFSFCAISPQVNYWTTCRELH